MRCREISRFSVACALFYPAALSLNVKLSIIPKINAVIMLDELVRQTNCNFKFLGPSICMSIAFSSQHIQKTGKTCNLSVLPSESESYFFNFICLFANLKVIFKNSRMQVGL